MAYACAGCVRWRQLRHDEGPPQTILQEKCTSWRGQLSQSPSWPPAWVSQFPGALSTVAECMAACKLHMESFCRLEAWTVKQKSWGHIYEVPIFNALGTAGELPLLGSALNSPLHFCKLHIMQ
jgi:hypothetical protein